MSAMQTNISDQYKQIEENNRMGKTGEYFKKIRDIKGTFNAKMGTIKDINRMDLTETGNIKRWKKYKNNYTKRIFMTQIIKRV